MNTIFQLFRKMRKFPFEVDIRLWSLWSGDTQSLHTVNYNDNYLHCWEIFIHTRTQGMRNIKCIAVILVTAYLCFETAGHNILSATHST